MDPDGKQKKQNVARAARSKQVERIREEMIRKHMDPRSTAGRLILCWTDEAFLAGYEEAEEAMVPQVEMMVQKHMEQSLRIRSLTERMEAITERASLSPRPPLVPLLRMCDQTRAVS